MLGVATLIVVNSVMAGFSTKLKDRLHGLLSDVIVESPSDNGFPEDADDDDGQDHALPGGRAHRGDDGHHRSARHAVFEVGPSAERVDHPVHMVGIDPQGRAAIGGFGEYLHGPGPARPKPVVRPGPGRAMKRWSGLHPPVPDAAAAGPLPGDGAPAMAPAGRPGQAGRGHRRLRDHPLPLDRPGDRQAVDRDILPPGSTIKLVMVGAGKRS